MAKPLKRLTTTRSVVEAWAANSARPSTPGPIQPGPIQPTLIASMAIKAIPGRRWILDRLPFLSCRCAVIDCVETSDFGGPMAGKLINQYRHCRCAVIVDADNIRVGGHWVQSITRLVSVRLRLRPGFRYPGDFS